MNEMVCYRDKEKKGTRKVFPDLITKEYECGGHKGTA
jgi:hypothetical protein